MSKPCSQCHAAAASLPVRGAWIEMLTAIVNWTDEGCRSPCGERGLKCRGYQINLFPSRRSPCGERGLKYCPRGAGRRRQKSLPVRGAWIEISQVETVVNDVGRSPCGERGLKSFSPQGAAASEAVAPRAGSVD